MKFKKQLLAISIGVIASTGMVNTAQAGIPVSNILGQLYDTMGLGDFGFGQVGSLHRIAGISQQMLGSLKSGLKSMVANTNSVEEAKLQHQMNSKDAPDPNVCYTSVSAQGGNLASKATSVLSAKNSQTKISKDKEAESQNDQTVALSQKVKTLACTEEDVKLGVHGCSQVTTYGQDFLNPKTLYGDLRFGAKSANEDVNPIPLLKRDGDALKIADLHIERLMGNVPEKLSSQAQNSDGQGEKYNAEREKFLERRNVARATLEDIKDKSTALDKTVWDKGPFREIMKNPIIQQTAKELYPNADGTITPMSERMIEEILVKQYLSSAFLESTAANGQLDERSRNRILAMQLNILWEISNKLEKQNHLLAVILQNQLDPVTYNEVMGAREQVSKVR